MHIPDGYLSPQTCAATFAIAVPALAVASRRVTRIVKTRDVPLLAMFAAVSFLVMMLNVPVPGGTTAHAVGAAMIAIVLGPWGAMIAVSVALGFQALLFGDGGVLALGANIVNLAIVMPWVAWGVYRLVAGRSPLTSSRRIAASFLAGYVGITAAALGTAFMLGLQPLLFRAADGTPLYSPYSMGQTMSAMAFAHLLVAGPVEGLLTAGVFGYLVRTDPARLAATHARSDRGPDSTDAAATSAGGSRRLTPARAAWLFVAAMTALTPLGLLAPGGAFAEDAPHELDLDSLGLQAIPAGMERFSGFWSRTLLADYGFGDGSNPVLAYLLSAVVGIAVCAAAVYLVALVAARTGGVRPRPAHPAPRS